MVMTSGKQGRARGRMQIGAADPSLTAAGGMVAVTELCGGLALIEALDAGIGPVKARRRGFTGGQVLTGMAAAQLAGEDFLVGPGRLRADEAGQQVTPVPGLASSTATGLARRFTPKHWRGAEAGLAATRAVACEYWYRHRTSTGNIFGDSKHGAALRHLPSGYTEINTAWMRASLIAAAIAAWLHQLTGLISGGQLLEGHGTRGGKAMIATLPRALILTPARLVSHGGQLIMRLAPGAHLLPDVLTTIRALPAPSG